MISKEEHGKAIKFWESLSDDDKWDLGDDLVLGTFSWCDWFEEKPSSGFMNALDMARIVWEVCQ